MAQLAPKHVAEWKLHKGYRCFRRKTYAYIRPGDGPVGAETCSGVNTS